MDLSVQFAGLENLLFQEVIKDMNLNDKKVFHGAVHPPADAAVPNQVAALPDEPTLVSRVADEETKASQIATEAHKEVDGGLQQPLRDDYRSPSEVYVLVRDHV